jgi:hypothetical protein
MLVLFIKKRLLPAAPYTSPLFIYLFGIVLYILHAKHIALELSTYKRAYILTAQV